MKTNLFPSAEQSYSAPKLIPISDVLSSEETTSSALKTIAQWSIDYLCHPHPELGRAGVVCPYTPISIKKKTFWLTEIKTEGRKEEDIKQDIISLAYLFHKQEPQEGEDAQFKTIVSVWSDISVKALARFHQEMKPVFLHEGLMFGEFFSSCKKRGLWNANFYPLRSPIPLLAIREILEADIVFLSESMEFVEEYINKYGERGVNSIKHILNSERKSSLDNERITVLEKYLMYQ
ncbi:hypothetical protein Xmau_01690 [Xenorhabdus mauleonii]|uniref:DUF6875 domain-containing protein n=1 Tax=Xenorhabdus mauleonii TaxID=351675 RepID=A0A1I3L2Y5_9GAMM|nr:hypothetical protein [Xenorhabdus mauleonii]PHM44533.1 hypothetical protein Xmau_01690 [Xenorhabdus mauleonii]SFI79072.1 hypothetical protein SAMN05421680_103276 [Xenorhabdus mauleonii]